ncbi:HEPN domain-containing protein [Fulvivirgaceae bacterium BMA10]|uniref:HEPN domain-containing protein n=1 Tax=Splendidivirga corallicola TaxID=3051826 RepID=A0ABT8KUQ0_9BACT|nr:HEPN domain-containing protein [Fulvivirgaceae bacterium BMA10]
MTTISLENVSKEAKKDIIELQEKIEKFKKGKILEERFKAYRLTRGVYGQRQLGVQMFRLKIPYGKITTDQLIRVAEISEEYTNGNLHATTRQNFQMHYVKLEDSPEIWTKLEEAGVTAREACGNTVRNVTASALAGIDPEEPFDVAPYAEELFQYFLRNPICQDMGRKIKIAFSSSEKDSAFTYIHDFGFIPRVKTENGQEVRGFKVLVGGGLGAQSIIAPTAFEFLQEDQLIPFTEAAIRVFDRYGEREKRGKARLKFLIEEKRGLGLEKFLELVEEERKAIPNKSYTINRDIIGETVVPDAVNTPEVEITEKAKYEQWLQTNVFEQKQKDFYGVHIKLLLGNISSEKAKELAAVVKELAADDIRITINQGLLLKFVRKESLPYLFYRLNHLNLADTGFGTIADVTACPGTDTCNLGVTNSTGAAVEIEKVIRDEFPHLIADSNINIKISGCMNSCGQHMIANIGFHGSSIKNGALIVPALQVVIGGGIDPEGKGFIADKVIKLPTKKIPDALRILLHDYEENTQEGEYFNDYYQRQGKIYFYDLLKSLGDLTALEKTDYIDWGHSEQFIPEIGTGECAGVSYDVVSTIITDAEEKLYYANEAFAENKYSDSIYNSYNTFVVGAKALLLSKDVNCNTHIGIIRDFDIHFYQTGEIQLDQNFESLTLQINKNDPTEAFAKAYLAQAEDFLQKVKEIRKGQIEASGTDEEKLVINNFYKA